MEMNGVAVAKNHAAFEIGCRAAMQLAEAPEKAVAPTLSQAGLKTIQFVRKPGSHNGRADGEGDASYALDALALQDVLERRVAFLTDYQNAAYANRYRACVERVIRAEQPVTGDAALPLSHAVARSLFKLMAYKDEYEVARLHSGAAFQSQLDQMFEGEYRLTYHLAPPILGRKDASGRPVKNSFGASARLAFRVLAALRGLRGTRFDIFGGTAERQQERALANEFQQAIESRLPNLRAENHAALVRFAKLPQQIRGFGHVKARQLEAARQQWDQLLAQCGA